MIAPAYRDALVAYIRSNANPADKFSHQARLYQLAANLAADQACDDDVLFAAAWMHDLGVFIGHRPDNPDALATWDCLAYVMAKTPALLESFGFPTAKVPAVVEAIRTHQPHAQPTTLEGIALRDADILEQLGAVGILRTVSKVGRDTRFRLFSDALRVLEHNLIELPAQLKLESARRLAEQRVQVLKTFLDAAASETSQLPW